jgi:hypothetical protein
LTKQFDGIEIIWQRLNPLSTRAPVWLLAVIALLLCGFWLRTHNILAQDPYIDEGFHNVRAAKVWDFQENPGRFAHGKVLLYFWLGIFHATPDQPLNTLAASRLGMAIWATLTAATLCLVTRLLFGRAAALLALALYVISPLSFFFERMAMADTFAAGWAVLIAWRSLAFARRPTLPQGALLGLLCGFVTLAKLTMGLVPLLPALAALIYFPWRRVMAHRRDLGRAVLAWAQLYLAPLALAALIVALMWAPLAIPAYLARNSDRPFILVNDFNIRANADEEERIPPLDYARQVLFLVSEYTTVWALLCGLIAAWLLLSHGLQLLRFRVSWVLAVLMACGGALYLWAWWSAVGVVVVRGVPPITIWPMPTALFDALGALWIAAWLAVEGGGWTLLVVLPSLTLLLVIWRLWQITEVLNVGTIKLQSPVRLHNYALIEALDLRAIRWQAQPQSVLFVLMWVAVMIGLPLAAARLATVRYFVPLNGPLVVFVAALVVLVWHWRPRAQVAGYLVRGAVGVGIALWALVFAVWFAYLDLNAPLTVPLSGTNNTEYVRGFLTGDVATRALADQLNRLNDGASAPPLILANWNLCHLLFFYSENPVTCLHIDRTRGDLSARVLALPPCQTAYFAVRGFGPFWQDMREIHYEEIGRHERPGLNRPAILLRVWHGADCPDIGG